MVLDMVMVMVALSMSAVGFQAFQAVSSPATLPPVRCSRLVIDILVLTFEQALVVVLCTLAVVFQASRPARSLSTLPLVRSAVMSASMDLC
jgi:hypothetical protein